MLSGPQRSIHEPHRPRVAPPILNLPFTNPLLLLFSRGLVELHSFVTLQVACFKHGPLVQRSSGQAVAAVLVTLLLDLAEEPLHLVVCGTLLLCACNGIGADGIDLSIDVIKCGGATVGPRAEGGNQARDGTRLQIPQGSYTRHLDGLADRIERGVQEAIVHGLDNKVLELASR